MRDTLQLLPLNPTGSPSFPGCALQPLYSLPRIPVLPRGARAAPITCAAMCPPVLTLPPGVTLKAAAIIVSPWVERGPTAPPRSPTPGPCLQIPRGLGGWLAPGGLGAPAGPLRQFLVPTFPGASRGGLRHGWWRQAPRDGAVRRPQGCFHPCVGCTCCECPKELATGGTWGSVCPSVHTGAAYPSGVPTPPAGAWPPPGAWMPPAVGTADTRLTFVPCRAPGLPWHCGALGAPMTWAPRETAE